MDLQIPNNYSNVQVTYQICLPSKNLRLQATKYKGDNKVIYKCVIMKP